MLTAKQTSVWRGRYDLSQDGTPIAVWDPSVWKSGGRFELAGRAYQVRSNAWGTRFTMTDELDIRVAEAERVGRKTWTVLADGRTYAFRRPSFWRHDQELMDGDTPVGLIRRTSAWRNEASAELPGLPLPLQVFVMTVILTMWRAQDSAAAA
ncbi:MULTISPECIES: hypothetical protein [Actinoplanes]|uniref:hypothetical protein n=1 Tax=Actinoplanes TaxID=1865 RepID=UPI0005F2F758|nr:MULTISPECIES: hypothetical protein [Actinoplanes]GLX99903.1 hypothetical protein Acsp01_02830 [Actinoplanes sp. NBRC 101535]